ncbi:MAG TPA: NfeD family protein [Verrucomicrobiae bacterium]|jgi:membrane-bound serine protease (ClpP class)|nr:NfeD family protein [Verrucomicrobiae bacterium]
MRKWLALLISLLGLAGGQNVYCADTASKQVYVVPIRQDIDSSLVYVVRRGVKEAMAAKADLLVIDMDTDGGSLKSMMEIIDVINEFKGQTVTYVNTKAFSAGALICFSTQKIYMAPQSVIGAAAPVQMSPGGGGIQSLPDTVEVKVASAVSALIRAEAEKNGYNVELVDAMVNKTTEFKIGDKVINEKGQLLTLTDNEAAAEYGKPPKPLLSSGTISSMDALLEKLGYAGAARTVITPTGAETLGTWINAISPILLIVGIIGIYIELKTPGVILPGVVAVLAFLLYFTGGYVAGLSGMEWVLVFVVGLALIISEFFVHPGTILPGLVGAILIFIALVMAMVDMYPGTPALPTLPQIELPMRNIVIALGVSLVIMAVLARFLPKTSIYRRLVSHGASGEVAMVEQQREQASRLGEKGMAISNLRPGGKAQFGNDIVDVITQGEMIEKGQAVRIIGYSGAEAIVEAVG